MNKRAISELGEECGLNIPKSEELRHGEIPKTLRYPIITKSIKSIEGKWKDDVYICNSEYELLEAYKAINSNVILAEEFIEKETEFCYDAFAINNGEDIIMPFKATYIRSKPGFYGNYIKFTPTQENDIVENVKKMIRRVGFTGIFEAEFLIGKDGSIYFLEINFRNSTWSYPMTFGGVNMLYYWAKGELCGKLDESMKPREKPFIGLVELVDFKDFVLTGKVSLFRWIYELFSADCLFYFNVRDMKPLIMHILDAIINRIYIILKIKVK